jgi:hypothetical protein
MASTSIVEATKSPLLEGPASDVIHEVVDSNLVAAASDSEGSSYIIKRVIKIKIDTICLHLVYFQFFLPLE